MILDGASLTPSGVAAVARDDTPVELAAEAHARNRAARQAIAAHLATGGSLYGANTGVGALRDREVTDTERDQFQLNLLRSHAVSAGPPLARAEVRAGMVTRANQIAAGGAGTAPELLDGLVQALNHNFTPLTRELGSLGTGDLPALAEVALALLGEGEVVSSAEEQSKHPVAALVSARSLSLRDALGFISSNAFTAGLAALICVDARALQDAWLAVAALSFEALAADPVVLAERVQLAHGMSGQRAVAARLRALLDGAEYLKERPDRPVQGPYPFRVLPQVDGVAHDATVRLERVVSAELNSRPENALIDAGEPLPNGNFHAAELAAALDALRGAMAQSASLIAARVSTLLDPRMSGLPAFLAHRPGPESGVMMLEYTAQAAAAEIRSLAMTMAPQTAWASLGVESHASLAATSARRTAQALDALWVLVATEFVVAVRATRMSARVPSGAGPRRVFALAQTLLPDEPGDRAFGRDVEAVRSALTSWRFD